MLLTNVQKILDDEFKISQNEENLVDFSIVDNNEIFVNPDFLSRNTALMTNNSKELNIVLTSVFITEEIVKKSLQYKNALIFTHHNFDYFENEKGLQPIKAEYFEQMKKNNISIYVAHAPLDTHKIYGTSKCLAETCGIKIEKYFYDYFGAPTALIGSVNNILFDEYSQFVQKKLERPIMTLEKNKDYINKIAVVAGGGDVPDILQQIYDSKCDTLLTGTVEHRWNVPFIQDGNKKFHELNRKLKVNLIGGTHYGTERLAMIKIVQYFKQLGINCKYIEDDSLLNAI